MRNYILDGKTPILCEDMVKWGQQFQSEKRHVGNDMIGNVNVSTVFLGIDHSFDGGSPMLFETMVFGGELDQEQERYSTWEEAELGHKSMIEKVKQTEE